MTGKEPAKPAADPPPAFERPIRWDRLRADDAARLVRRRTAVTGNVIFTHHALERAAEREISDLNIRRILLEGDADGQPVRADCGGWKVVMVRRLPGKREAGAVCVVVRDDENVIVVTVEWMDLLR